MNISIQVIVTDFGEVLFRLGRVFGVQRLNGLVIRRHIARFRRAAFILMNDERGRFRAVVAVDQRFFVRRNPLFAHFYKVFHTFFEYPTAAEIVKCRL